MDENCKNEDFLWRESLEVVDESMPDIRLHTVKTNVDLGKWDRESQQLVFSTPESTLISSRNGFSADSWSFSDFKQQIEKEIAFLESLESRKSADSWSFSDFKQQIEKEIAFLESLESRKSARKVADKPKEPTTLAIGAENWRRAKAEGVRKEWLELSAKGELHSSGLPLYMHSLVEGTCDEFEKDIVSYCKLAGLKYKTTKEKLEAEAKAIRSSCEKFISQLTSRVDKLVENYRQMEM